MPRKKMKLHVTYPEAQRVRAQLLSTENPTLNEQERDTVLQILRDIFPVRQQRAKSRRPYVHQRRPGYKRQSGAIR